MGDSDNLNPLIGEELFVGYMYVVLNILFKLSPIRNSCNQNDISIKISFFWKLSLEG